MYAAPHVVAPHPTDPRTWKRLTVDYSIKQGVKAAQIAGLVSGAAVYAGHKYSPWFRRALGTPGKIGLVVGSTAGAYYWTAKTIMDDVQRHPWRYDLFHPTFTDPLTATTVTTLDENVDAPPSFRDHLARVADYVYDHPFMTTFALSVPIIGGIFANELRKPDVTLQRAILHTRVQGQMSVVAILMSAMAFRDYMCTKRGYLPGAYYAVDPTCVEVIVKPVPVVAEGP